MKKMLCLLLVAMLLVATIPVAASAMEPGMGERRFTIYYQVRNGSQTAEHVVNVTVSVPETANDDVIINAARNAVGGSVSANTIKNAVASSGGAALVQNIYDPSDSDVDTIVINDAANNDFAVFFRLTVRQKPPVTTSEDQTKNADLLVDDNNDGVFDHELKDAVPVTLLWTSDGTVSTYSLKRGATVEAVKAVLGAEYKNKTLSIVMQSLDSSTGKVIYRATVLGTSSNTTSNVIPNYDGTNNGGVIVDGNGNVSGGGSSNNSGSGSNNGGSSNTNNGTSQNLGNGGTGIVNGSNTDRNRFPYDVVLHIYQNNKVDEPVKNIVINDSLAADGVVSLSEVKTEVMKHFSAKTSAGIGYAGLYYARGNWVKDYATYNGEYDSITGIDSMRQVSQVDINVMITNATAKTTSTAKADSSNPKTGDTIFVPVMVMGLTATALAAAYVFGKKRIAR